MDRPTDTPATLRKIGDLARELGLTARTLRYWESLGLLPAAERSKGGQRLYGERHAEAALGIERLKEAGLPLDRIGDIQDLLVDRPTARAGLDDVEEALRVQIASLESQIAQRQRVLGELRGALSRVVSCNGCGGKAYDTDCIRCLEDMGEGKLPALLRSLLTPAAPRTSR